MNERHVSYNCKTCKRNSSDKGHNYNVPNVTRVNVRDANNVRDWSSTNSIMPSKYM